MTLTIVAALAAALGGGVGWFAALQAELQTLRLEKAGKRIEDVGLAFWIGSSSATKVPILGRI